MTESTTSMFTGDPPSLTLTSRITLYPISSRQEGDECIVSCPALSLFLTMPPEGVEALQLLAQGHSLTEVAQLVQSDDQSLDLLDFVQTLTEYGLVSEIDGCPLPLPASFKQKAPGIEIARWIQGKHVRWLFGKTAFLIYFGMLVVGAILLWRTPQNVPQMGDMMMMSPSYAVDAVAAFVTSLVLILIHEFGHIFAARAMGVNARLGIGRRLYYIVSQSYVDNLWQLPPLKRWVVYLGGMVTNVIGGFLGLVILIWQGMALPPLIYGWLKLFVFTEWFALGWQFLFYMRTDIYYLVADLLRAPNMMDDAQSWLGNFLHRIWPDWFAARDLHDLSYRERRVVQIYTALYLIGIGYALYILLFNVTPYMGGILGSSFATLRIASRAEAGAIINSAVGIAFYCLYLGLLFWFLWKQRPRRIHARSTEESNEPAATSA
jgi:putative peptide zinc metalloprotease protein